MKKKCFCKSRCIGLKEFFKREQTKRKLRQIERKVLGFKLYDWQRQFILNNNAIHPSCMIGERASGKTLTYDLSIILNNNEPNKIISKFSGVLLDEPYVKRGLQYRTWHYQQLKDLYTNIQEKKIKVNNIKFLGD